MVLRLDGRASDFPARFARLVESPRTPGADVRREVEAILARVAAEGDAALLDYTARFDRQRLRPEQLRIGEDEIADAVAGCPAQLRAALELAAARIERLPPPPAAPGRSSYRTSSACASGCAGGRSTAVGIYVPGGTAAYPSSVLMNAIPARIAGVGAGRRWPCRRPDGALNPLVLVAAHLAGVDEIYRVGGAQAIAALAFGTASIAAVDKIVGPGNAYVAEAKRQVFGRVGIDMIAGPSEIVVVADGDQDPGVDRGRPARARPSTTSAHRPILITDDAALADAVAAAVEAPARRRCRARAIAAASWRDHGADHRGRRT